MLQKYSLLFSAKHLERTKGDTWAIVNVMKPLFPALHRPLYHQLISENDMKFFKKHDLNQIWQKPNLLVPKMINLDEQYRMSFRVDVNDFNTEVEKTIQEPKQSSLFGEVTNSDEQQSEDQEPEPPKKKKKVFLHYFFNKGSVLFEKVFQLIFFLRHKNQRKRKRNRRRSMLCQHQKIRLKIRLKHLHPNQINRRPLGRFYLLVSLFYNTTTFQMYHLLNLFST